MQYSCRQVLHLAPVCVCVCVCVCVGGGGVCVCVCGGGGGGGGGGGDSLASCYLMHRQLIVPKTTNPIRRLYSRYMAFVYIWKIWLDIYILKGLKGTMVKFKLDFENDKESSRESI